MRALILCLLIVLEMVPTGTGWAETLEEGFLAFTAPPRIFLRRARLHLLKREKERQSMRWREFQSTVEGGQEIPERGFALSLFSQVTEDPKYCQQAIDWALGPTEDLRQVSLVYDWCQQTLTESQGAVLITKMKHAAEQTADRDDVFAVRDRVLAAVALTDALPEFSKQQLQSVVQQWWRGDKVPRIAAGEQAISRNGLLALFEILHVLRDNLSIDLRAGAPQFFRNLPVSQVFSYYPTPIRADDREYFITAGENLAQPDPRQASLTRAAGLCVTAYDRNARGNQFLQGWLMHDRFLLRSAIGVPYEFLWADPYQPGLSYYTLPLDFYDSTTGQLFLRSSWDEDAAWLGYAEGTLQSFESGSLETISPSSGQGIVRLAAALVAYRSLPLRLTMEEEGTEALYVVNLKPGQSYRVDVGGIERTERAGPGGIIFVEVPPQPGVKIRIQ